jgi:hypothetical protein
MLVISRKWITLSAVLAAVVLYILLGMWPTSFTTAITVILLICGLALLFIVNVFVSKNAD